MSKKKTYHLSEDQNLTEITRRDVLLRVGVAGVGVLGLGLADVVTDSLGQFEVRVAESGEFPVQLSGSGFHARSGVIRVAGNLTLNELLLEDDAGLPMKFLDQYARATGPNAKEGVVPRTPGATNRWTRPPRRCSRRSPGRAWGSRPSRCFPGSRLASSAPCRRA